MYGLFVSLPRGSHVKNAPGNQNPFRRVWRGSVVRDVVGPVLGSPVAERIEITTVAEGSLTVPRVL
jgi:hypothetical protein